MKRPHESQEERQALVTPPKAKDETAALKLRIEELEPRLTPQSSTSILD